METWLIWAIVVIFVSGLHNFTLKIAAERNYDVSVINFYSYLIGVVFLWLYLIYNFSDIDFSSIYITSILALWNSLFFFLSLFSRVEAMKNVDTVIFFPLYKTFWPILVTIISLMFFKEVLEFKEIIWIAIWIMVPILLITSSEKKRQKNLSLGLTFIIITSILTALSGSMWKEMMLENLNIWLYLFIGSVFGLIFSMISYKFFTNKKKKKYNKQWLLKLSIISWLLHLVSFISFSLALEWNFAVVFTISSFSILIPIILSIIFYKDHFNTKKWLIIALSIISIILFI